MINILIGIIGKLQRSVVSTLGSLIVKSTDYGHMEGAFFSKILNFWEVRHFGLNCFEAFEVFLARLSVSMLVL